MTIEKIVEKLDKLKNDIKKEQSISVFPSIINALQYIYNELEIEQKQLSPGKQFLGSTIINDKIIEIFSEIIYQYMKLRYDIEIKIEKTENYNMSVVSAGYDYEEDTIKYTPFGLSIGAINKSSYLQTFLHEARHKIQHAIYKETEITKILKYPPQMIILAKEIAFKSSQKEHNKEFYKENYDNLYHETEAEKFSIDSLKIIILDLFLIYIEYAKQNDIKISKQFQEKVREIQSIIQKDGIEIGEYSKKNGRLNPNIVGETYGIYPIKSTYTINDENIDRLIVLDKYIKNHPEIQITMPIFKLIFNGEKNKTYDEIIEDKQNLLKVNPRQSKQIERLYNCIIKSDPILYLTHLIVNRKKDSVIKFLEEHPTIFMEYQSEIEEIINQYYDNEIIDLLNNNQKNNTRK